MRGRYFEQLISPKVVVRNLVLVGLALLVAVIPT